jgi:hypothetical protein
MQGGNENVLISQNTETCTGDKAGDGEAIAFDGTFNFNALPSMVAPVGASSALITLPGPIKMADGSSYAAGALNGFWITVAQGRGMGQTRRISSYTSTDGARVIFRVTPAWDVPPESDSQVVITKQYWQVYVVDNFIDQSTPTCQKSNVYEPAGGKIVLWGQTADSVVEGNTQHDTSGILMGVGYNLDDPTHNVTRYTSLDSFVEVRGNDVEGEYAYGANCSLSGISVWLGADPLTNFPPPVESYGLSISHNTINRADGLNDGAISMTLGWYGGPPPATWDLIESALVFQNTIGNVDAPLPAPSTQWPFCPNYQSSRIGVHLRDAGVWHTVLAGNSCTNVTKNLLDTGTRTKRVCSNAPVNSCECSYYVQGNEAVAATTTQGSTSLAYQNAQLAGDLNLVVVDWVGTGVQVSSVVDTAGNTYQLAAGPTVVPASISQMGDLHQSIYYANNIVAASSNTVTVTFAAAASGTVVRVAEYQGLDPNNPFDTATGSYGTNTTSDSGWMTTSNANDLLIGANLTPSTGTSAGAGYTSRLLRTDPTLGSDIIEDRTTGIVAAYHATAPVASPSPWWVAQVAAFRLAGDGGGNTQALTVPTGLTATATSSSQISLSWGGSADDIEVSGYIVERCQGPGCTNFAFLANVTGATTTSYIDGGGLTASTQYSYRVRAYDTANLLSGYTAPVSATTPSGP